MTFCNLPGIKLFRLQKTIKLLKYLHKFDGFQQALQRPLFN